MPVQSFNPSHLIMAEPVPFGQRYSYPTSHDLALVTAPGYFNPARNRLRAGDTIRAVRLADSNYDASSNWVIAYVDLMVMEVSAAGVKVAKERPAATAPAPKPKAKVPPPPREKYIEADGAEVVEADDGYAVELDGERIAHLKDLASARDVAAGTAPLPQ